MAPRWSEPEIARLAALREAGFSISEMAGLLGRTYAATAIRLSKLGLTKTESEPRVTDRGYVMVRVRGHRLADKHGDVYQHRIVAEEKIGRPLRPGEHVHHLNGVKGDNRPENLDVISAAEHSRLHNKGVQRVARVGCVECGGKPLLPSRRRINPRCHACGIRERERRRRAG